MNKQYISVAEIINRAKPHAFAITAGLIFTMFAYSDEVSAEKTYVQANTIKREVVECIQEIKINNGGCVFSISNNSASYCTALDSFTNSFLSVCSDEEVMPVFNVMASKLAVLPIKECYADYSVKNKNIHFNMFLSDDLRLSIDKPVSTKNDEKVAFSLFMNRELLVMDYEDITSLIEKVQKLMA